MISRRIALTALPFAAVLYAGVATAQTPVTIGAIEILTGPNNKYGIAIKNGFELVQETLMDLRPYGVEETEVRRGMVRPAKPKAAE